MSAQHPATATPKGRALFLLSLAALGVVFGDIGTSPLYAMRECFHGPHGIAATPGNIIGVLSLIVWSLIIVISIKYLIFILRADNRGEGGILALSVLVQQVKPKRYLVVLGLFGAALLYSDGIITPAISVLSAVEGLEVAAPALKPYVIPITVVILVALFVVQKRGTETIGQWFGPVTLTWFLTIGVLGLIQTCREPGVLMALNPLNAVTFFVENGWHGFITLGAVFLVVTGGEALYADIGHFGIRPIRVVWFALVLPSLLLNYFGQGALLLTNPEAAANPFFALAPKWALYPLIILASSAAVIASQALITGAFSLTMQAVQLGYSPRIAIHHTCATAKGQIYLPMVNWMLMFSCIALVIGFGSSSNLAAAYGISITSTMIITTLLFYVVARWKWKWNPWLAISVTGLFVAIDLAFLGANATKIFAGGWFPLVMAAGIYLLMSTWQWGRKVLSARMKDRLLPLEMLMQDIQASAITRVPGTAFFLSGNPNGTPPALLHNLKHNKVIHERVVILNVKTGEVPHVPSSERVSIEQLELGFWKISMHFGFMDDPDVPAALEKIEELKFKVDPRHTSFFLGRETILPKRSGIPRWRETLFSWMSQNARDATSFFSLPPNCVVELGAQVEI